MQVEEVREHLDVDLDRGLTSLETSRRRDIHGFNEVSGKPVCTEIVESTCILACSDLSKLET